MQEPISHPSESKLLKTGWIEIYSVYKWLASGSHRHSFGSSSKLVTLLVTKPACMGGYQVTDRQRELE